MEVLVPSQTPALVLPGGLEILAVKVCEICQGALTHTFARGMCPRTHFLSLFINPQHHSPSHVPSDLYIQLWHEGLPISGLACFTVFLVQTYNHHSHTRTACTSLLPPTLLVETPSPSSMMPSDVTCPPQRACGK